MNSVEGFLNLVKKDKGLQDLVSKVDSKLGKTGNDEEVIKNDILPVARERGFNFTEKEFLDYINEATKAISKENLGSVSGGDGSKSTDAKPSGSGNGKKIMAVVAGGAVLGGGGMFAFKQIQNMNKPQAAQVQTVDNNKNGTVNAQETEAAVANDGLRPEENKQTPAQQSNKTSDNLKDTLKKAPSEKDQKKENKVENKVENKEDKKEAKPAAGPQQQTMPKITKEQVDYANSFLDTVINNGPLKDKSGKVIAEHIQDYIFAEAEKSGQKVTAEDKNKAIESLKEFRDKASDEEKVMFMQIMFAQAMGATGQAPQK